MAMPQEDLDRFARQVRHKILDPQPVLDEIAELKARVAELEAEKAAAQAVDAPKTKKHSKGEAQ